MNVEQESKRGKIFIYVTITVLFIAIVVGITYAFFAGGITNTGSVTVNVTTSPQVEISYESGNDLVLVATEPGMSATEYFDIKIDSDGSNITGVYNLLLNITSNGFVVDPNIDPNEDPDSEIYYDLYYSMDTGNNKTWTAITEGGDLTAVTGSVTLASNEILTANNNASVTKYYKIVVTYPNLPKDQSYNMEKTLTGTITFEDAN